MRRSNEILRAISTIIFVAGAIWLGVESKKHHEKVQRASPEPAPLVSSMAGATLAPVLTK